MKLIRMIIGAGFLVCLHGQLWAEGIELTREIDAFTPLSSFIEQRILDRRSQKFISRSKLINFNVSGLAQAEEMELELFDNRKITLSRTKFIERGETSFGWFGDIVEIPEGQATFSVVKGDLAGHILSQEGDYHITYLGEEKYLLEEINSTQFPQEAKPLRPVHGYLPAFPGEKTIRDLEADKLEESLLAASTTVDIAVFYTGEVANAYGSIKAEVQNGIDLMNAALERSQVSYRVRLTYRGPVTYSESTTAATELTRLTSTSDGYLDEVHSLRTSNCADIISLWTKSTADACGVAWLLADTTSATNSTYGFNVVDVDCANSNLSFPHEVGHNLGANHDTTADPGNGLFSYSHGHFVDQQWRTILAYSTGCTGGNCPRVGYYSNPSVSYNGAATGVANVSDNALTFATSMPYVATYVGGTCTLAGEDPDNLDTASDELIGSQCFIATATYGHFYAPELKGLRKFRDNFLVTFDWGRKFIRTYYHYSPALAQFIQTHSWAKRISLIALTPIILAFNWSDSRLLPLLITTTFLLIIAIASFLSWIKFRRGRRAH